MKDCLLIDESVDSLVEMINNNRHIASINVCYNFISAASEVKILEAVRNNRSLLDFAPWGNHMDKNSRHKLRVLLESHRKWRRDATRAAVQVLTSARVLLMVRARNPSSSWPGACAHLHVDNQSQVEWNQDCVLSVFPGEIVEMMVASLAEGYLTDEETRLVINWGCDRSTLGLGLQEFLQECMQQITYWPSPEESLSFIPFEEATETADDVSS